MEETKSTSSRISIQNSTNCNRDEKVGSTDDLFIAEDGAEQHLSGWRLYGIVAALSLSVMLVALDNAILATAVPTITTAFNSLNDVGWYGSAFLISICACQPLAGKVYQHFSLKWSYQFFLAIFELGSLLCATSTSSPMLIIGRAVAGVGASGLFSGALIIIAHSIPLRLRPVYTGVIASMFGVAQVSGPLLGGALTQHASWRWCFYINLPFGAVAAALLTLLLPSTASKQSTITTTTASPPFMQKLKLLELPSFFFFIPPTTMLLLALQWGGNTHSWDSATILGLLLGSAATLGLFIGWQWHRGDNASIPLALACQRTVACSAVIAFLAMGSLQLTTYYLPLWFQMIKGASPTRSGVMYLPAVLGNIIVSLLGGIFVTKVGYYNPVLFFGGILIAVGGGLLITLHPNSSAAAWIGFQVIAGAGFGALIQTPLIAIQAVLPLSKVPAATCTVVLCQFLGGAIFLSIAQNVFESELASLLSQILPSSSVAALLRAGGPRATTENFTGERYAAVLATCSDAITRSFWIVAASGVLALVACLGVQWKSVKGVKLTPA